MALVCSSGPSPDTSWGLPSPTPSPALLAVHRATVKPVLVLLPVLGLTWLVGLLVHLSPAWAYAAVGLNSLQVPPGPGPSETGAPTCTGTRSGWLVCQGAGQGVTAPSWEEAPTGTRDIVNRKEGEGGNGSKTSNRRARQRGLCGPFDS